MKYTLAFLSMTVWALIGCKKKDSAPPTIPTLTTAAVTNISGSTAQSGGVITDNGGATITASGICWSKTNNLPTVSDDTAKGMTASGSFISILKNLQPSATYYVRAYAVNSAGTGYGNVVTFNTGNSAPQAKDIIFIGTAAVTNKIKVRYTFLDFENDAESGTTFQWYIATDTVGGTVTAIPGTNDSIYTILAGDQNKFLRIAITPKASAGTSPGAATNSYWVGPVGAEPTSVTFTYNGTTVTYGIITSPITQKKWLDRNLGASRAATSTTDYLAYGDLFQWGRPADGHQLITWTNSTTGAAVNIDTTMIKATTDIPGHSKFIATSSSVNPPNDWRSDANTNRWNMNRQGPCPLGWHVPTRNEWDAEAAGSPLGDYNATNAFNQLKITLSGLRTSRGVFLSVGAQGQYWGSDLSASNATNLTITTTSGSAAYTGGKSQGMSVRCIKD